MPNTPDRPVLFIGAGNMATAISRGAQSAGVLASEHVAACALRTGPRDGYNRVFNRPTESLAWLEANERRPGDGVVLLAVKPQKLDKVAAEWRDAPFGDRLVISVLAGITGERVASAIGGRVVRVMPNTPSAIGLGCSGVAASTDATEHDVAFAMQLFGAIGRAFELPEDLIDAFTGVAGSGPAYLFYLAQAMAAGARDVGLPEDLIGPIVAQTLTGAASLLAQSGESPEDLRARVTSKNGTTFAATSTFDRHGVQAAIREGVRAARDRGRELASDSQSQ